MTYEKIFTCCERPKVNSDKPTMEVMAQYAAEENAILQFLDWLQERGLFVARYVPNSAAVVADGTDPQRLVVEFFGLSWNLYRSEQYALREQYKDVYEFWDKKFQEADDRAKMIRHAAQVQQDIEARARTREVSPLFRSPFPEE